MKHTHQVKPGRLSPPLFFATMHQGNRPGPIKSVLGAMTRFKWTNTPSYSSYNRSHANH